MSKGLIFYDIEIFPHDAMVVFKDIDKNLVAFFHNDFEGVRDIVKNNVLIGYNNHYYDDKILTKMMANWSPRQLKDLNDGIIARKEEGHITDPLIESLDCFQQIDVGMPGLKKIEGNMGKMILESSVPFDIDRPLTDPELNEVFEYCAYDVDMVVEIYNIREKSYFQPKERLLDMMDNPSLRDRAKKWNTTTISANVLVGKSAGIKKWSSTRLPEWMWDLIPHDVQKMWEQVNKFVDGFKPKSVTIREFDNDIQFGFGGLHGAHIHKRRFENVKLLDVASMYPNIILNIDGLSSGSEKYKSILEKRIEIKHVDEIMSDALKLILNSAYGNLNNQYSILNNPRAAYSVCFYGQVALYELCRRLSPFCTIVNINTDGVAFTTETDDYKDVWHEWEKDFNLSLEEKNFELFIQKDVNNYTAIHYDKNKNERKVYTKGGMTTRYNNPSLFRNNNARILDIALVDHLLYEKDLIETLMENRDKPDLYQYILQAGHTYEGTSDRDGNMYNKINRVFPTKKGDLLLQKKRPDGGLVRFADAPEIMYLWNDDCSNIKDFEKIVDLNHYYQILKKRLSLWE